MRGRAALAVLAAAGGAVACSAGAPVRTEDYRAQATRLCAQSQAARGDAPAVQRRLRRVLDLVPPPELAARHEELRDIAALVDRVGRGAARGTISPARALERIRRVTDRAGRTYRAMGVPACARVG